MNFQITLNSIVRVAWILTWTTTGLFAQGDRCISLINNGMYNTFRYETANSNMSSSQSQFCSAYYAFKQSGTTAGLEASYGLYTGKGNYSASNVETVANSSCADSSSFQYVKDHKMLFNQFVSPEVLASFDRCVEVAGKGLDYTLIPSPDGETLTISLNFNSGRGNPVAQTIEGVVILQVDELNSHQQIKCPELESMNKPGGVKLDQQVKTINCTRSALPGSEKGFSYMNELLYRGPGRIVVKTNVGPIIAEMGPVRVNRPLPPKPSLVAQLSSGKGFTVTFSDKDSSVIEVHGEESDGNLPAQNAIVGHYNKATSEWVAAGSLYNPNLRPIPWVYTSSTCGPTKQLKCVVSTSPEEHGLILFNKKFRFDDEGFVYGLWSGQMEERVGYITASSR